MLPPFQTSKTSLPSNYVPKESYALVQQCVHKKKQLPFGATQCTRHGPTDLAPVSVADDVDPSNASSYGFILLDGQIMLGKGALL